MNRRNLYREEAIPLVMLDPETKRYTINNEALEMISQLPSPIGVVGVAGMYRTGKSYLLNRMILDRSDGFGVGPTVNPCTKGLWVWGKPLKGQTSEGEPCSVLVIDSEGLGALDEDTNHDSRIFSLTVLLSSCFIYNSVGSIDENALQNLSLVVNLTKNIQLKSQPLQGDNTFEEFSQYFPQFYWVVRDFSLQLVDQDGEVLTSRNYLERALQIQKGFTDDIEQKNRIRRLLQTFFKERDCITLVRPLTKEENLQNLDKLEFDKLRPEFYHQVLDMRKKIINRVKPKQLNNVNLSGQMYCDLLRSYVTAINQGAVPVIESAWNYICRNECQKSLLEALEHFDEKVKELSGNRLPLAPDDLKQLLLISKESARKIFHKREIGDVGDEYLKELNRRMRVNCQAIKQENEREGLRVCLKFIQLEFEPVDQKLKRNEYRTFQDFEQEIRLFCNYYMENAPVEAQSRQIVLLEKMNSALVEGGYTILKMINHENEVSKAINEDNLRKAQSDLREAKAESLREKNNLTLQVKSLERQLSDLMTQEQINQQTIEDLRRNKVETEEELKNEFSKEKAELLRDMNELKNKLVLTEEKFKELERNKLYGNSEVEKNKALFNQKLEFLEKSLEESSRKERDLMNELRNQKQAFFNQQKETQQKIDQTLQQLNQKISDLQEKLNETENEITENESKYQDELRRFEMKEKSLLKLNADLTEANNSLNKELKFLKYQQDSFDAQNRLNSDSNLQQLQEKLESLLQQLQQKDETIKQQKHQSDKDRAIFQQKIDFYEVALQESKRQAEENRKTHDAIMSVFQNSQFENTNKNDNVKISDIREQHKRELRQLEQEKETTIKKLQSQVDLLNEKNSELELKVKFETGDMIMEMESLKQQLNDAEVVRAKLMDQNKSLDSQKGKLLLEQEQRYKTMIKDLEQQVEYQKKRVATEVQNTQEKAEEALAQLKNFYELERERLENRICEEKDKNAKRHQSATDEYQQKIKEQEQLLEDEIESLREELRDQEATYQNLIQQYEHDKQIRQQQIDNLESKIKDLKENYQNYQNSQNTALEQQMNMFTAERKEMINKNEQQSILINKLQKDVMALEQRRDFLENEKLRKEVQLEQLRKSANEERREMSDKLEEVKNRLQSSNDEYLEKKIEYGRELALVQQQNEFLQKRIDDLQKTLENQIQRYEEKLKQQKIEIQSDMNDKTAKAIEEKSTLEAKYEKTKKALKESESNANRQISNIEREKAIIQEKLQNYEQKLQDLEIKQKEDLSLSQSTINNLKEQLNQEKRNLSNEIERAKQAYNILEKDKNEIQATYDRDRALWDGKFEFLESQKEQAKQDLVDALKKFEMTLMHLQRARKNERDDLEANLGDLVSNVERKYQTQIEELNQSHQRTVSEYEDKLRKLQKDLKNQKDQLLIDQHGKIGNQLLSEKKFSELLENEKRLHNEIEQLKAERDIKITEYQKQFDQERDSMKQKIAELEARYKDIENKRNSLIFEFEKERAKWNLDKDHLVNIKNELIDQLDKLERKKEVLLRENEKMKNEQRATRRSVNTVHNMTSHTLLTGNKYKPGGINNVSTIQQSSRNQQLSPTHSCNTSTSSANLVAQKTYQTNLADITNFSQAQQTGNDVGRIKQAPQSFYMLGDEVQSKYQSYYDIKKDTSPMKVESQKLDKSKY